MTSLEHSVTDRIVVIRNERCSHASRVQDEVITPFQDIELPEGQLVEFRIPSTNVEESTERLAEILRPGDRLISPAGDGTGNVAVNAAMLAGDNELRIGFLPYGNFNDMAATFTSRSARQNPVRLLTSPDTVEANPLQVFKNGEHHRYALLYANIGWTAQVAAKFETPKIREALQSGETSLLSNLLRLAQSYASERGTATLPKFQRDDRPDFQTSTTDVLAVNGPIMGKVVRSARHYYGGDKFLSSELDITSLLRNIPFLGRSTLNLCLKTYLKLPGAEVSQMRLDFDKPVEIPLQIDGEYEVANVHTLTFAKDADETAPRVRIIAA